MITYQIHARCSLLCYYVRMNPWSRRSPGWKDAVSLMLFQFHHNPQCNLAVIDPGHYIKSSLSYGAGSVLVGERQHIPLLCSPFFLRWLAHFSFIFPSYIDPLQLYTYEMFNRTTNVSAQAARRPHVPRALPLSQVYWRTGTSPQSPLKENIVFDQ